MAKSLKSPYIDVSKVSRVANNSVTRIFGSQNPLNIPNCIKRNGKYFPIALKILL